MMKKEQWKLRVEYDNYSSKTVTISEEQVREAPKAVYAIINQSKQLEKHHQIISRHNGKGIMLAGGGLFLGD